MPSSWQTWSARHHVCQTPSAKAVWQVQQTQSARRRCLADCVWLPDDTICPLADVVCQMLRQPRPSGRSSRRRVADGICYTWQTPSGRRRLAGLEVYQTPSSRQCLRDFVCQGRLAGLADAVWQTTVSGRPRLATRRHLVLSCNWSEYEGKT